MTPDDILTLARQGNPKVIAAIMSRSVRSHGIEVRVMRQDECLYVLLEGALALRRESMISFVQTSLMKLRVESVQAVKLYGRLQGQTTAAWKETIALHPLSVESSSVPEALAIDRPDVSTLSPSQPAMHDSAAAEFKPDVLPTASPASSALGADYEVESSLADETGSDTIQTSAPQNPLDNVVTAQLDPSQSASSDDTPINDETMPTDQAIAPASIEPISASGAPPAAANDLAAAATTLDGVGDDLGAFDQTSDELAIHTSGDLAEDVDFRTLLKRPEALVLLAFVIAVFAWQFYVSLLDAVAPEGSLTASELARRLDVSRSTISRRKHQPGFSEWTQQIDPDAIAWVYTEGAFVPLLYQPDE